MLRPGGAVLVAGQAGGSDYCGGPMWVARLTPRGRFDRRFGRRGSARVRFPGTDGSWAQDLALDGRGRIVLAGGAENHRYASDNPTRAVFALARLRPSGRLDRSFGRAGRSTVAVAPGPISSLAAIALTPHGLFGVGTSDSPLATRPRTDLVRYAANGRLARGFGLHGVQPITFGWPIEAGTALAATGSGGLLIAAELGRRRPEAGAIGLAKLTSPGQPLADAPPSPPRLPPLHRGVSPGG